MQHRKRQRNAFASITESLGAGPEEGVAGLRVRDCQGTSDCIVMEKGGLHGKRF